MSCFLPPACLFCIHYHADASGGGVSCTAFDEIPDAIFRGEIFHALPFPGDRNIRFELNQELAEEFAEINETEVQHAGTLVFRSGFRW